MTPADLLNAASNLITTNPDNVGLIDRCSIYNVTTTTDAGGYATNVDGAPIAVNVPCLYEDAGKSETQISAGAFAHVTHNLYLLATAATRVIKPNYAIVVASRDNVPQRRFERPVMLEETFGPLVHVAAAIVV